MKNYHPNKIENTMLNIIEEGKHIVLKSIEEIKDPIKRSKERQLYYIALNKLGEYKGE